MNAPLPWWSKKWWYPNCCCKECIIFHDDCRGHVLDVPAYWYDQWVFTGSSPSIWVADAYDETISFGAVGYGVGNGFLICRTEITEAPYNCIVAGRFLWATATDLAAAYLLCDYVDDDNFHWVEVDHDGSRTGDSIEVKFWDRTAGTDTQIGSTITVDSGELTGWPDVYVVLCKTTTKMTLNIFSASTPYGNPWPPFDDQDASFFAEAVITDKSGKRAGIGTKGAYGAVGGTRPDDDYGIRVREFWLERTSAENSNCETCDTFCCTDALPLEFDVDLSGLTDEPGNACDNCSELNDVYTLTLDSANSLGCQWSYTAGYGTSFWECEVNGEGQTHPALVKVVISVQSDGGSPESSDWLLKFVYANSEVVNFTTTRSNYPGVCEFLGTESWTPDMNTSFPGCSATNSTASISVESS